MALTYNEISAITQKHFVPKLVDNIFGSNPLLSRAKKNWMETVSGGEKILVPVAYATTSANGWYTGTDTLDTAANDQITSAEFDWKFIYSNVTISRTDELKNSGSEAIVNFVKSKIQLAEKTLADSLGTGLYNTGTTTNAIIGLRLAVDSAGTYGGINRTNYSWWSAQEDSTTTALSIAAMQALWGDCTVGSDVPSVIMTCQDVYDDYYGLLQPQQRFQDKETASGGFTNLLYNSAPVIVDSHCPSTASALHMFMLNESYLSLKVHRDENFRFEPFIKPTNQNVATAKVYWAGALCCSNPRMQGKLATLA